MRKRWYAISVLVVCLLITIVNAREEKVLTIEHEEGTWRTNIKYYVYTVDDGTLRVEARVGGELSQLIGSDITQYNLESDSQVRFTVNVLLAKSWNELGLGISSGLSEGQAVLFTTVDGKSHRFTYADVQQRAWILPEALKEAGLLSVDDGGAVSTGGPRTATPVAGGAGDISSPTASPPDGQPAPADVVQVINEEESAAPEQPPQPVRGATPVTPTYPPSPVTQQNCIACQQIDQVWEMVRNALSIVPQPGIAKPVWEPEKGWVSFESVYAPAPPPVSAPAVHLGISPVSPSAYDPLFIQYGQQHQIPPALLKAISAYESGGINPNAIGPSGEVGLFQLTHSTAQSLGITPLTACCTRGTGESYLCKQEKSQKAYLCNAANDRRFDPVTNMEAGARLVAGNYNTLGSYSFASDDERLKATIAAHNTGVARVEEYIKKIPAGQPITWNDIANQLPAGDCPSGRLCQNRMNKYVNTIYNNYLQYKTQIPVG